MTREQELREDVSRLLTQNAEFRQEIELLRKQRANLRDVLNWTDDNCPGRCAGRIRPALEKN